MQKPRVSQHFMDTNERPRLGDVSASAPKLESAVAYVYGAPPRSLLI